MRRTVFRNDVTKIATNSNSKRLKLRYFVDLSKAFDSVLKRKSISEEENSQKKMLVVIPGVNFLQ